ncbi:MAG: CPBP family intramembrane glutamic endopeptidase [Anaerolineae bacterium]
MKDPNKTASWTRRETLALIWIVAALVGAVVATGVLETTLPIFTFIWPSVPLVVLLRTRDARRIGIRKVAWRDLLPATGLNLVLWWGLMAIFEPWTHIYRDLVREAMSSMPPDTTFAWLARYSGAGGWVGMVLYSGLVSLFGEELFFHGWLLQLLSRRMARGWAIALQATLLSLPQLIVMLLFPPLQAVIWITVYSWLAVGAVGGWFATQTKSIWPSLIAATLTNLILTALVLR